MPKGPTVSINFGSHTIDLERKLRLTKARRGQIPGTVVEGVLGESPTAEDKMNEPFTVHLVFADGVNADWIPMMGDSLENVDDDT